MFSTKHLIDKALAGFLTLNVAVTSLLTALPPDRENISDENALAVSAVTKHSESEGYVAEQVFSTSSVQTGVKNSSLVSPLPDKQYRLTSYYGGRCTGSTGAGFWHNAVDLAATDGTPIYAIADGVVDRLAGTENGRTGVVYINHGTYQGKKLSAAYAHMWEPGKHVKVGQKVKKGQKIAEVGSSGISSGPHLHFTVQVNGVEVDPLPFMKNAGIDFTKLATTVRAKPKTPQYCEVYTWANTGLKEKPQTTSKTVEIVPRGTVVHGYTGKAESGYYKVKNPKTGKTGYMFAETLGQKQPTTRSAPKTTSTPKNVRYTAKGTWHFRDYPSTHIGTGGIIDTIQRGEFFTTTGRKATGSGYTWFEVVYNGITGWVPNHGILEAPTAVTDTKSMLKNGRYTPSGSANIRSYPDTSGKYYTEVINIKKGQYVVSTGRLKGSYMEVTYQGKKYWGHKDYLTRVAYALPKTTSLTKNISYKAKANNTRMRNYPSTNATHGWNIKTLSRNSTVKTTGRKVGNWAEVTSGSTKGWVDTRQFNRVRASLPKLSSSPKNYHYTATANNTRIRNYPSTKETQGWNVKTLKKGNRVTTTGRKYGSSWLEVKSGSTTGWVQSSKFKRVPASLPKKLSTTTKNVWRSAKSSQQLRNYPSSTASQGWRIVTIKKNARVKTTGRKHGSYIEVTSGSRKGWVLQKGFQLTKAKTVAVKNTTMKKKAVGTTTHTGGSKKTISKNKKVRTTGWTYGTKVQVRYGSRNYWVPRSVIS